MNGQYQAIETEIANIDWSDPIAARAEAAALNRQAQTVRGQMAAVETQQAANGCAPG